MTTRERTILLVEDNPDDEELILRALRKNNIANEIAVTRDGAEALDYLHRSVAHAARSEGLPQVVLLDLRLPKLDGLEVLQRIRSEPSTHTLPVVVLTSSDEERDILGSYSLGVNSYVRKPVQFAEFVAAIQQLGMYWLLMNRPPPAERR
ncbi:MAG: response regulator [Candidatus Lambdaproteobacteria bacterium]|nr:response regulator [Candidatus Lambdaproteobacteria bacterium]